MKLTKRIVSMVLLLALVFGMVPVSARAADNQATVDGGETTFESTNSFGSLLSQDLQAEQADTDADSYPAGYNVIDLTVENGVATVAYDTQEEAILVVSLYTEDGLQMLLSGKATVQPEETEAVVLLEGEMPEYFMASAYLLDTYDHSPLCASYSTPMYTKEMQELLASTVEDYDQDQVLNLDDDHTTNFAVYAESTKVLEYTEGVNTVVSANDDTATYVIENANEYITGLQKGDVMAYPYGEEQILIVKVASISVNGTTATITGDELEMEEVFSHVKIEQSGDAADIVVDESTAEEGVTFEGLTQEGTQTYTVPKRAIEDELNWKNYLNFKFTEKKFLDHESEHFDASASLNGKIGISLDIKMSYYVTMLRQYIKFENDVGVKVNFSISGKLKGKLPLPEFKFTVYGVSIGFEPKLQLEFSGKVECSLFTGFTIGFAYEHILGIPIFHPCNTTPKVEIDFKAEASIFFGVDLSPQIELLGGVIAEAKLEMPVGLELKASMDGTWINELDLDAEVVHSCERCVKFELSFKLELSAKLTFLKCEKLGFESKVKDLGFKIADMYWSIDYGEFGWSTCPHKSYRVTTTVLDASNKEVAGADVYADWEEQQTEISMGTTNSNGVVVKHLPAGTYTLKTTIDGEPVETDLTVEEACKVTLSPTKETAKPTINHVQVTDYGTVVESGTCGDNLYWNLYSSGVLKIYGNGEMEDYLEMWSPWSAMEFTTVVIEDGVTSIGSYAFEGCWSLTSITIPDSVTYIDDYAFLYCSSLTSITIPDSVTSIGDGAFSYCSSLTAITIPDSVTSIGDSAFLDCNSLTSITLPDSVTSIGNSAFSVCSSLTSITIPDSVTSIGDGAFSYCSSLTGITIPDSVTSISDGAFAYCSSLTSITIPDSVTSIGDHAFRDCSSLTSITIPDSVTSIGDYAFLDCSSLTSITLPDSVTSIGYDAFSYCSSLKEIRFTGDAPDIARYALYGVKAKVYYPSGNSTWTANKRQNYGGTLTWVAYTPTKQVRKPATKGIFGGQYGTEEKEDYTLKTASFKDLVPGAQYVLLALVSLEAEDLLAPSNLLYIAQNAATEDGTLAFSYVQRVDTAISYVMACGASHNNLQDAVITFPEMEPSEALQVVNPTVTFNGKVLTEGVDYVITGTVDYTTIGIYTCTIRGIYNYSGTVSCTYTVGSPAASLATSTGIVGFATMAEVMQAYEDGTVTLLQDNSEELTVSKNLSLDLNGFDLTGAVTVEEGCTLTVKDSQTDDYTVEDAFGYGQLATVSGSVVAAEGYLMVTDETGISAHRIEMVLTDMVLRPDAVGVYYKSRFSGDEIVAQNVAQYGVALSVKGEPTAENPGIRSWYEDFASGTNANGTLLKSIMKTSNTEATNAANSEMAVYGSVYLLTTDGQYLFGSCVSRSLRQQLELIDGMWNTLDTQQQGAVLAMYETYASVMQDWALPNILAAI